MSRCCEAVLSAVTGCEQCAFAGSLRRIRETGGDMDILAAAKKSGPVMAVFAALPAVDEVIAHGSACDYGTTEVFGRPIALVAGRGAPAWGSRAYAVRGLATSR
jgi:hypothetical protein